MRLIIITILLGIPAAFGAGKLQVRAPGYGWQNGDYTVSHVFIDEVAGTSAGIEVRFDPEAGGVTDVEVFTNLNRRELATTDKNGDNEHDGILPVPGNDITDSAGDTDPVTGHYYIPHNLVYDGSQWWTLTIPAVKTGSYRLTARFKTSGNPDWQWYGDGGARDHCVVVSPVGARDIRMYEVNVLNVEASGTLESQRSTWEDLSDRPGAIHTAGGRVNDWNLGTMADLGVNWLWFQPYHPFGLDGRDADGHSRVWNGGAPFEDFNYPFALGSPYAVKNFWEIEPRTSAQYDPGDSVAAGRAKAMVSFRNFVADADAAGMAIMPDAAFNHTAFDVELGQEGVDRWSGGAAWAPTDEIRNRELRVFSREDDYYQRAGLGAGEGIAPAPDRYDFGKWNDVKDIFFGRYAALWRNSGSTDAQKNEGDWFDATSYGFNGTDGGSFDAVTRGVWRYFGAYVPYWLEMTRPAGQNRNSVPADGDAAARYAWDDRGIDGLRCDFGQGLPPRCWEYIINRAKSVKWNFVFMSESLDGGEVTYRSGRHFDVLNENLLFAVKGAADKWALRTAYEDRRTAYGQAVILLNTTSHDEENYDDPWAAMARYAANSAIDGAPMIFSGQELGATRLYGYDLWEFNASKWVPHFKTYNSMMPLWGDTNFWNDQLATVYGDINKARLASPALRSSNRWILDGNGNNGQIFGVAKYEEGGVSPMFQDVVLAFVNLSLGSDQGDTFVIPAGLAPLLGLDNSRLYNVRNIAAYERPPAVTGRKEALLWDPGISGSDLQAGGFSVFLKRVPASEGDWGNENSEGAPWEAQYLKLVDVTPVAPFEIIAIASTVPDVAVTCETEAGRWYHLETSTTLEPGSWTTVVGNVQATG
ncbi:MAG: hypothetical protein HKO57_15740, partial [Akkermansiaceae bacterium]|nr:hypothetical protein [Akkermansiaceae bacterium]